MSGEGSRIVVSVVRERGDYATSTAWLVEPDQAAAIERMMGDSGAPEVHGLTTMAALERVVVITDEGGESDG